MAGVEVAGFGIEIKLGCKCKFFWKILMHVLKQFVEKLRFLFGFGNEDRFF